MNKNQFFISTIAEDAAEVAKAYGFGIEIASFCTAWNIDEMFEETDAGLRKQLDGIHKTVFHAPYNELFPCAIDKLVRQIAEKRYCQAIELANRYGAEKVVIHGGYNDRLYFPIWYIEESVKFWQDFMIKHPDTQIVLENVVESEPDMLLEIVQRVDCPNLKLCLDIGHVNAYSKVSVYEWLEKWAPMISHFHIHNNDRSWDMHNALFDGSIPMETFLTRAFELCPDATFTMEVLKAEDSARWLEGKIN